MRKKDVGAGIFAVVMMLGGCGGSDPGADSGPEDGGPELEADSGNSGDAGGPDASLTADAGGPDASLTEDAGAGAASVRWVTVVEPREIDGDIGLDYAFEYELLIDGDPFVYSLDLERCTHIAGTTETCETGPLSNVPGTSFVRWGVDPSTYAVGENHYRFRLILTRGAEAIDEETLDVELNVTSCIECVGAGTP